MDKYIPKDYLTEQDIRTLLVSLRKVNFLSIVSMETIDKIAAKFFKQAVKKGTIIIKQGQQGKAFYVIKKGKCVVYRKQGLFLVKKIAELKDGDFFGEMSLIFDNKTSANVKATEDTELFVLLKTSFVNILNENPELKKEIEFIAEKRKFQTEQK
ncbi:MAG: cyclic nucleotide-binding domain-containing protein [Endomicrobia bacterium]|nr:cyclic nucleotide-binding domain-containing protein [Endomicrobiia bacterium]